MGRKHGKKIRDKDLTEDMKKHIYEEYHYKGAQKVAFFLDDLLNKVEEEDIKQDILYIMFKIKQMDDDFHKQNVNHHPKTLAQVIWEQEEEDEQEEE